MNDLERFERDFLQQDSRGFPEGNILDDGEDTTQKRRDSKQLIV